MVWVQRIIWVVLAIFSVSVVYIVFSGGVVKEENARGPAAQQRPTAAGSMAYDRYLPGQRQGPPSEDRGISP